MRVTMAQALDLNPLIAPLSEENPCGLDLRQDFSPGSLFLKIKDARSEARRLERAIDMESDGVSPNGAWETVYSTGLEILTYHSKDLEIAAWVAEAVTRLKGLKEFGSMLSLSKHLIDTYWEQVYPLPDEDGYEGRISPFSGLNGANDDSPLVQCLRRLPLTDADQRFGLWDYQKAVELDKIKDQAARAERIEIGFPTLEKFNEEVALTSGAFFLDLLDSIDSVKDKLDALYDSFHERVGTDAPPASGIRKALDEIEEAVNVFARNKIANARALLQSNTVELHDEEVQIDNPNDLHGIHSSTSSIGVGSPLNDREDAFRQLLRISSYFRKNEPHSPISYVLEELVRRGRMPLPELLNELITDGDARKYYFLASGIGSSVENMVSASVEDA